MTAEFGRRRHDLFHELLDVDAAERSRRLAQLAVEEPRLAGELSRLVAAAGVEQLDAEFTGALRALVEPPELETGQPVGPYRLVREIGRGGMGAVWEAVHTDTDRAVALKVLPSLAGDATGHARVAHEYRLLASLDDDPHIARLFDVGTLDDGTPWFAMELVRDALPITRYCTARAVDLAGRLRLFRDACVAVRHAHGRGVIHRDLKPSNILVSGAGQVRLVDFGIACALVAPLRDDDARVSMQSLTPAFAAPEQLDGAQPGTACDLYVLGLVLYELLTDTRPFDLEGCTTAEALVILTSEGPRAPSAAKNLAIGGTTDADWGDLDALCLTLLAPEPGARYASADGLVADLDRYRRRQPLLVRTPSFPYRLRKFVSRHRAGVAASAAAVAGAVVLASWYGVQLAAERAETAAEAARTERLQQYLFGLFAGAEPDVGPARDLTVRRLLERGALTADLLRQDPDAQADMHQTLGGLYTELGDFPRAEALLEQALAQKSARLPAGSPRRVDAVVALAMLRIEQGQLDDAERLARDAIAHTPRAGGRTGDLRARADLALGRVLTARGRYDEAIAQLQAALPTSLGAGTSTPQVSALLSQLAAAHQYAGHLDDAERLHRQALAIDRQVRGASHPTVADTLISLAEAESSRGRYEAAEPLLREARQILLAWYGPEHPETGSVTRILAGALTMQGRLDEAEPLLHEAIAVFERAYAGPHRRLGLAVNDLGTLAFRRKRFGDAVDAYQRALDVYRQVFPDGRSQYISIGLANLGSAYLEHGDIRQAEQFFREAVALSRTLLTADHPNTAIAEIRLGDVLVRRRQYDEAMPLLQHGQSVLETQGNPSLSWLTRARAALETARARGR